MKGQEFVIDNGGSANVYNKRQTMSLCSTIGLGSLCIATVFVPKVESGEWADVPKVELDEQRVKKEPCSYLLPRFLLPHSCLQARLRQHCIPEL